MASGLNLWQTAIENLTQTERTLFPHFQGYIFKKSETFRGESRFKATYNQVICSLCIFSLSFLFYNPRIFLNFSGYFIIFFSLLLNILDYIDTYYVVYYRRYSRKIFALLLLNSFFYISILANLLNKDKISDTSSLRKITRFIIWANPIAFLTCLLIFSTGINFF